MYKLFVLLVVSGCALKGALLGGVSTSDPAAPVNRPAHASPGLSDYATRFINDTNALKVTCPAGPTAPAIDWQHECWGKADAAENLYKSVDEKTDGGVQHGLAYLQELRKSIEQWKANDESAETRKVAAYRDERSYSSSAHNAEALIRQLEGARDGKVTSTLISFEHRDAGAVQDALERLAAEMPELADVQAACEKGTGDKAICDIAKHRDALWKKLLALQFTAILDERLEAWTTTVGRMKDDGLVAVVNYNSIADLKRFSGDLGKELLEIGKVLGQANTRGVIDAKVAALHASFMAATNARQSTDAWSRHAKDATYQDAAVTKAVHQVPGLAVVRVGATEPTWDVIRGDFNQPVQRNRYIWALMRKPGEPFCRLYEMTVIEQHMGGGRYGAPRADAGDEPEFYVSACR